MGTIVVRDDHEGPPTFQAKIRKRGYPITSRTFSTRREAKEWMTAVEAAMNAGTHKVNKLAQSMTMKELFETYRDSVTVSKRGKEVETIRLNVLAGSKLAQYSAANVTRQVMAKWRDDRLKEVTGSTVNRELNLIGHVFEKAMKEWGVNLPENPVHQIERPAHEPPRERRLRGDEEARLLAACRETRSSRFLLPIVLLAIETAMRQGELVNLRWEFVNITKRHIHLVMSKNFSIKNGSSRVVSLSRTAIEVLESLGPKTEGRVFPDLMADSLKRAFSRATARAEIEDFHFHDLRHEATSRLFEKGLNIAEVRAITGHKSLSSLERYVHVHQAEALAARLD